MAKSEPSGEVVEFTAVVSKIQTLADGGLRFAFDVDESCSLQAAQLMECKRWQQVVMVAVRVEGEDEEWI